MDRSHLSLIMLAFGLLLFICSRIAPHLKRFTSSATSPAIGSDQPPPRGTIEFNAAILDACGARVSDAFKLGLLKKPDITIAAALKLAREEVERGTGLLLQNAVLPAKTESP